MGRPPGGLPTEPDGYYRAAVIGEPNPRQPHLVRARRHGAALTFDDGPDPIWTPAVLKALGEAGARATFFVIAPRAAAHPELIEQMLAAGHEVGLHCAAHIRHTELSCTELSSDTDAALATLADLSVTPQAWRAPWGLVTSATRALADARNLRLVGWSADTHDWRGDDAEAMYRTVEPLLSPAAVILMHDGIGPGARRTGASATVRLTRRLTERLADRRLLTCTVSELA